MSSQNHWIKRTDRQPVDKDFPVLVGEYAKNGVWIESYRYAVTSHLDGTHWRSVKCTPPPRELTQREKDEEMVRASTYADTRDAMLKAVYSERREVAKLVANHYGPHWGISEPGYTWVESIISLRARCDEQGVGK